MADTNAGRPATSDQEKENILQKLEPYLKSGLSVNKACLEAKIPKSTVYDFIEKDSSFSERIEAYKNFMSVMVSNSVMREFSRIIEKQQGELVDDGKGNKVRKWGKLDGQEIGFIQWVALNSQATREEFGRRQDVSVVDPQLELKKLAAMIDEAADDDYPEEPQAK